MMLTKQHMIKYLIILGFLLSITSYVVDVITDICVDNDSITALDDIDSKEENSEEESSEKKDSTEKNLISVFQEKNTMKILDRYNMTYPYYYLSKKIVFLEYTTPPPRIELLS